MVSLRALEPSDLSLLYCWENDRNIWRCSNTLEPFSKAQLKAYIDEDTGDIYARRQLRLMIDLVEAKEQRTIGAIDLFDFDPTHQRAGLGILIAETDDRHHGYAAEAIHLMTDYCRNVLFMHQIYCNIAVSNESSIRLFENAGFVKTGVKREWLLTPVGWEDELLMQKILCK